MMGIVIGITFLEFFGMADTATLFSQTSNPAMNKPAPESNPKDPKQMYADLRDMMLQGSRAKFGLPPTAKMTEPWGVVMDWGVANGTASVVAMSDGSASVYLSSGGGYMGGKGIEPVRLAAQKAVEAARSAELPSGPTTSYPLPEPHGVFFYFLTDGGVYLSRTNEAEMSSGNHPLRQLGGAMQVVISQFRLWQEQSKKNAESTPKKAN